MATLVFQAASTPTRLISTWRGCNNRRLPDAEQFLQQFHVNLHVLPRTHRINHGPVSDALAGKPTLSTIVINRTYRWYLLSFQHLALFPVEIVELLGCR